MVYEKITNKVINQMCSWLEFYDLNGYFPWEKKKVVLTISGEAIEVLKTKDNKSEFVNGLILSLLKGGIKKYE